MTRNEIEFYNNNVPAIRRALERIADALENNINDGFVICGWDGLEKTEQKIKQETKATIRCLPLQQDIENIKCIYSDNDAKYLAVFSKAY